MTDKPQRTVANVNGIVGANLGASIDNLQTTESTLVALVLDKSGSMSQLRQATIDIVNDNIRALADGDGSESLLASIYAFNGTNTKVSSYQLIADVKDLTPKDYSPEGGTALYDAALEVLSDVEQYTDYLKMNGQNVRQILVFVTDGEDQGSRSTATAVKSKIDGLLKQETYTIILLGLGEQATFTRTAFQMGIPTVLTTGNNAHEFRNAVGMVSRSISKLHTSQLQNANNSFLQP